MSSLRKCLSKFATGVTVVTCRNADDAPCGITANSFSSVSLEPPLVSWNIAKESNSLQAYLDAKKFAIHVLAEDQGAISTHFARTNHTRFDGIDYSASAAGVPILPNCLALLECSTFQVHDCGDHYIIVGEVDRFSAKSAKPLLFFDGHYDLLQK